jgi:signal transduction histidine kinase
VVQFDLLIPLTAGIPAVSGVVAGTVAVVVFRRLRRQDVYTGLGRSFVIFTGLFTALSVGYAVTHLSQSPLSNMTWLGFLIIIVPWAVFVIRYAGMEQYVTVQRILVGVAVVAALIVINFAGTLPADGLPGDVAVQTLETAGSIVTLGMLLCVFALVATVVVVTYAHDRLPTGQGVVLALPIVVFLFTFQATRPSTPLVNDVLIAGAFATTAGSLALGVTRYDLVTRPAGTQIRGERAALTETDEAIVVLNDQQQVIRANESAVQIFGGPTTLDEVTEHSVATLTERKTIDCQTTSGRRQFEPSVSSLVNDYDETLGNTITLIDVTDREIRRQRLAVLNRILRHNVRNELDVIRAHAEDADLSPAIQGVDRLARLSEETRRVQQLMERSADDRTPTELSSLLDDIVADVTAGTNAEVTVTTPDITVTLDTKLCRYAVRHLVENAVEHNDAPVPRIRVRAEQSGSDVQILVADDGPGVPESEQAVIEAGEEAPLKHGSSFGLWGTNWAVRTMGGSLSFGDSDLGGAAVTITLPDAVILDTER